MTRVRFAPSPTGLLHVGNSRAAVLNWLFSLKTGGDFILRFDDTDSERSRPEYVEAIRADMAWLGIRPACEVFQSARRARYTEVAETLKTQGRLYACYETPEELDRRRKRQAARGLPPIYDRAALKLTGDEKAALEAQGRYPHWRFLLDRRAVTWSDLIRGEQRVDTASQSDPVLVRADGTYLYTLCSVVDDIDLGVTHVIRGEDHVVNTATQIEIAEALGATPPAYAHFSLLTGADGGGLSKRLGALSLGELRGAGIEPIAVMSLVALLGSSDAIHPVSDLAELVAGFDLGKLSRAPARFDEAELKALNAKLLHGLPYAAVAERVPDGEAFWLAVRGNIETLAGTETWRQIVTGGVKPVMEPEDRAFLAAAADCLPPEPWGADTWKIWTESVKQATGRKGKSLFMPLRRALTGLDHGPELAALLPLIGRERVVRRLAD